MIDPNRPYVAARSTAAGVSQRDRFAVLVNRPVRPVISVEQRRQQRLRDVVPWHREAGRLRTRVRIAAGVAVAVALAVALCCAAIAGQICALAAPHPQLCEHAGTAEQVAGASPAFWATAARGADHR
jgi:hypothetical protein